MEHVTDRTLAAVAALRRRELDHLRDAHRAHRAALDANFFGDQDECHVHLTEADDATYAALMCALEAQDLLTQSSDSSNVSSDADEQKEHDHDGTTG